LTKPNRSIASLGDAISIFAVLVTAVTQLYLFLFILKPIALKAALDEDQAQLNIESRASAEQLSRLELQDRELASDRQTLLEDRQLVARNTAATQAKLRAANHRDAAARAVIDRLETKLAAREAEQGVAAQHLAAARAEAAAQYKAARTVLIADVLESLRILCQADERIMQAELGDAPEDLLLRVYDDAVARVQTGVSFAALSPQDRVMFDQLVVLLRRRVEATKAVIAHTNSVWVAYKAAFRREWIHRGGPLDANGEPARLSSIKGFTRAELEKSLVGFGAGVLDKEGTDPLKLVPISGSFHAVLSKGLNELVPALFDQRFTPPHQKR
jgi:hypothetical protein